MPSVSLFPTAINRIIVGGVSLAAAYGPLIGGFIVNPSYETEPLYVDLTAPATLSQTATTVPIWPGETFILPGGDVSAVWVNAATSGHKLSGIVIQPPVPYPPTPLPGPFPPSGPTVVTSTIPSYLYVQYNDDDNLQAFVDAFNELAQTQIDWFVDVGLPVYTGLSGSLLDWVAEGLYGIRRPALPSGHVRNIGPFNTYQFNQVPFNYSSRIGNSDFHATTDDTFKRILTWLFFKGDGKYFSVRWLKRRVQRFLSGVDGVDPGISTTYDVSVTFGPGIDVNIDVGVYNPILKEAIDAGILELTFQFNYIVTIA